jgi:hypothetical protein
LVEKTKSYGGQYKNAYWLSVFVLASRGVSVNIKSKADNRQESDMRQELAKTPVLRVVSTVIEVPYSYIPQKRFQQRATTFAGYWRQGLEQAQSYPYVVSTVIEVPYSYTPQKRFQQRATTFAGYWRQGLERAQSYR